MVFALRIVLGVILVSGSAAGATDRCGPQVRDGWIRLTPGAMGMSAGYGRIINACSGPATLVGVRSPAFADVSMHETRVEGGISRMRPLNQLQLSAHQTIELAPGGKHLMLMEPTGVLKAGQVVPIDFLTPEGHKISGLFTVRAMP